MILIAFKEVNKLNRTFLPLLFPLSNINKTKLVVVFYFAGMWTIRVGVSQAPKIFLFFLLFIRSLSCTCVTECIVFIDTGPDFLVPNDRIRSV